MRWIGVHGSIGWVYSILIVHIKLGPPACMRVITVHVGLLDFRAHLGLLDMYTCGK